MSVAPQVKGWCPGALQPMMSGDGLVVRVRPFGGRLTQDQAKGIAAMAQAHGNGIIDLSSRANIQLRGVSEASYPAVIAGLNGFDLLDPTPEIEARRNIIVSPFWQADDGMQVISTTLIQTLSSDRLANLPTKFGFAIDTGATPVLQTAPADIRLERDASGGLLIAADGGPVARPIAEDCVANEIFEIVAWFLDIKENDKRMNTVFRRTGALPDDHFVPRQMQDHQPTPGPTEHGALVGLAFGQLTSETLARLADHGAMRLTPWRMLLVEGAQDLTDIDGILTTPNDPLLRVTACTGAPACAQGHQATRPLARQLARTLPDGTALHVSGCTKGCAHPKTADITITGTPDGFDLIRNGRACDTPLQTGLTAHDLRKAI